MEIIKGRLSGVASINDLIRFVQEFEVTKQDTLVNQLNIKSINGESILGQGNLDVLATLGNYVKDAEVNGTTLIIKNNEDKEIVRFTPITDEDRENLNKLSEIIHSILQIEERLDAVELKELELEEDIQSINDWAENLTVDGGEIK